MTPRLHRAATPDRVEADGAYLAVETLGDASLPSLLMLHGGMGTLDDLAPLAAALHGTHRIVAMDARGHGASTMGGRALSYAQLAADALAVLDALGIARTAVFGFSDGGIAAYRLALEQPGRIGKLVVLGAPDRLTPHVEPLLRAITPESWTAKFPETRPRYERLNPEPDFAAFVAASKAMWLDASADGYPGDACAAIRLPTLIARGDADPLFTLDEAVALRKTIEHASLLNVPLAAHDPDSQVATVAAGVLAFLSSADERDDV